MFFSLFNVNLLSCAFFQYFICNVWILCNIMFFLLFVMFGCYIKERERERERKEKEKKKKKREMGEGCEMGGGKNK
jgi:predicted membrane protein